MMMYRRFDKNETFWRRRLLSTWRMCISVSRNKELKQIGSDAVAEKSISKGNRRMTKGRWIDGFKGLLILLGSDLGIARIVRTFSLNISRTAHFVKVRHVGFATDTRRNYRAHSVCLPTLPR